MTVSDADGEEEAIEVHTRDNSTDPIVRLATLDLGHIRSLDKTGSLTQKKGDSIDCLLLINNRFELLHNRPWNPRELRQLDKGQYQTTSKECGVVP